MVGRATRLPMLLLGAVLLQILSAAAQEVTALDEITVTARKREESLLRVPVVESAVTQEALEKFAITDLSGVADRVPGILIGNNVGAIGNQLSIRGIGTTALNATIDQSVSLNIDGLPLSQALAYGAGLFDVGQVEVLKGPQALFFGKNSPAGVISLRSADPTATPDLTLRGGYEYEANERFGEIIASEAVAPSLKLRLAAHFDDQDGFFINDAIGNPALGGLTPAYRNVSPEQNWIARGTALFQPSDGYAARLKLNFTEDFVKGMSYDGQAAYCPDGTSGVPPINIAFLAGDSCKLDRHITTAWPYPPAFPGIRAGGVPFARIIQSFGTLEQNVNLNSNLTLTSVTGIYVVHDATLYPGSTGSPLTIAADVDFGNRQYTEELRLTSDYADSPINFMMGGFYQYGEMDNRLLLDGNTFLHLPAIVQSVLHDITIRSVSAFGQAIWNVTSQWEIAAGVRWTHETRDHTEFNNAPIDGPLGLVPLPDPHLSANNLSPEVSVTYKPTDDLTVFGSYKRGFKSGSFNTVQFIPASQQSSFGDEQVRGGEVGIKARLLDSRMALNIAGYRYEYSGLQVGANGRNPDGTIAIRTLNAASATVHGVDFDVAYDPSTIKGLSLRAALNWNVARYGTFNNAPCGDAQTIAQGCNQLLDPTTGLFTAQNLSGNVLVRAPEWIVTGGLDYERPVGRNMTLSFGTGFNYTTRYSTALIDAPGFFQDAFAKVNANIALKGANDHWEVALIGNNLGDEITAGVCANTNTRNGGVFGGQVKGGLVQGPAGGDVASCVAERGRELWLRLTFRPLWFSND